MPRSSEPRSDPSCLDHNEAPKLQEALSRRDPEYFADQMPEQPHQEIDKVRIRLDQSRVPASTPASPDLIKELLEYHADMIKELREFHNMSTDLEPCGDIVIIYGILPDNHFDRQQALDVVKKYAPCAAFA